MSRLRRRGEADQATAPVAMMHGAQRPRGVAGERKLARDRGGAVDRRGSGVDPVRTHPVLLAGGHLLGQHPVVGLIARALGVVASLRPRAGDVQRRRRCPARGGAHARDSGQAEVVGRRHRDRLAREAASRPCGRGGERAARQVTAAPSRRAGTRSPTRTRSSQGRPARPRAAGAGRTRRPGQSRSCGPAPCLSGRRRRSSWR